MRFLPRLPPPGRLIEAGSLVREQFLLMIIPVLTSTIRGLLCCIPIADQEATPKISTHCQAAVPRRGRTIRPSRRWYSQKRGSNGVNYRGRKWQQQLWPTLQFWHGTARRNERLGLVGSGIRQATLFTEFNFKTPVAEIWSSIQSHTAASNGEIQRDHRTNGRLLLTNLRYGNYRIGAGGRHHTTWTALPIANFTSPITGGTAAALDGNAVGNFVAVSVSSSITVPNGSYVMLRWRDIDQTGARPRIGNR